MLAFERYFRIKVNLNNITGIVILNYVNSFPTSIN